MKLQQLLSPPSFGDVEKDYLARALHIIFLAFLAILVFLALIMLLIGQYKLAPVLGILFMINLPTFWFLRRGFLQLTSIWALLNILGAASYFMYVGEGLQDVALLAFPIIIIVSSLILGRRTFILSVGISLVLLGLITYDEVLGHLYMPELAATLYIDFAVVAILLIVTAIAMYLITDNMQNNLLSIRSELVNRRQVEQSLQKSEAYFRSLIENSNDIITVTEMDGIIRYQSPSIEKILGYKPEEMIGKISFDFVHPDDLPKVLDAFAQGIQNQSDSPNVEYRFRHKDRSWRILEGVGRVQIDETDQVIGIINSRDITERKQMDEALRQSEIEYRSLFENVPDGIYRTTPDGQVLSANPALARMLGYRSERELKEAGDVKSHYLYPKDREKTLRKLEADGEILNSEIALKDKSGNLLYLLENARTIKDEQGRTRYFEGVLTDITERKQAEIELQKRKEDLELINKLNAVINRGDSLDVLIDTLNNEVNQIYSALYCTVYLLSPDEKFLSLQKLTVSPSSIRKIEQWIGQPIQKIDVPVKEGGQIQRHLQNKKGTITSDPKLIQEWMTEFTESTFLSPSLRKLTKMLIPQIHSLLNMGSLLAIPLISNGRTIGLLELASKDIFTENTLNRVHNVSEQITTAILRKQTEEAERDQRTLAEALRETAEILSRSLDVGLVLDQILNIVGRVVPHNSGTVMLIEGGKLQLARSQGYEKHGLSLEKIMDDLNLHDLANLNEIYESRKPVLIPDVTAYPQWKTYPGMEWLRSNLGAPLVIQNSVIGFIFLDSSTPNFFTPLHAQRLQAFADQAAIAVQNARLFEATRRQLEELTALHGVALAGIQTGSVDELIERITQTIGDTFFPDHFGVILLDERENVLRPHPSYHGVSSADVSKSIPLTQGIAGRVAASGQSQRIGDIRHNPDYYQITSETLSELCVPIKLGERVIGVLNAESHQLNFFTEADERLLVTIAGQAAIAIENFNLVERLQGSNFELEKRVNERTAELNQMNVELTHANRTKDEFLANMSHELRTPLNSILGFSETLLEQRRGQLNDKQEQYVELIHSSGQHLLSLINDILEVSKIEAGKLELRPDIISVKEVCESSLNFIKEMAVKKSISIEYNNESSVTSLRADPQRLKQILVNLLSNAVKFTPEKGKVSLDVRINDEKDQIRFSVTDNGIGMARENLPKLFIPFSQIDSSLSRQYEGTGLGLALVLKLTELHGGSVMVESEPGIGSRFTITIPWGEGQPIKTGKDAETSIPVQVLDEPVTIDGQPVKILLAEDNMSNVLTIQEYLSDRGFEVAVAHNGLEAIDQAEGSPPNIILMDIQMPKMDGLKAITRLRTMPKFASVPIIALTALAMPGDRERCLEAGANEYLSKPVSLRELVRMIEKLLGSQT